MPIVVVALALIAAISIGVIAWELSSDEFHKSLEQDGRSTEQKPDEPVPGDDD